MSVGIPRLLGMQMMSLFLIQACDAGSTRQLERVGATEQAMFTNGDFDNGTLSGWTVTTRLNPNSGGIPTFPPTKYADLGLQNGGSNYTKILTTATPLTGIPFGLTSPDSLRYSFRGPNSVVVNENGHNHNANVLRQTATMLAQDVDATDGKIHLRFAAAPVLHNPTHNPEQQPYFFIELVNSTTGQQLFNTFNFSNQPGVAWKKAAVALDVGSGPEDVLYTDWQAFDVAPVGGALNIGDQLQATVVAAGCSFNAHFGEVYVDQFGTSFPMPNVNIGAPAYVRANADLTYNVTVKNGGGAAATNTTVKVDTPTMADTSDPVKSKATTFVSVSSPGVTCATPAVGASGTVTCNIGTLGAGSSYSFTVTIHVPTLAPLNNAPYFVNEGTYNVTSDQTALLAGNLVQTQITTSTPVDLQTTLTDGIASLKWGDPNSYTLVVKNNGPSAVNGVAITDARTGFTFAGMTWSCVAAGGAVCGASSGTNTINTTANLPVGATVTYAIAATAVNKSSGTGPGTALYSVTAAPPAGFVQSVAFNNKANDLDYNDSAIYTLNLNKDAASTGSGTIVAYPGGFSCGTACTGTAQVFANNTSVAVTAITSPGSAFEGWTLSGGASGTCAGVTSPCVTTVTANGTIAARFDRIVITPTVTATSNANALNVRPGDTVAYAIELNVPNNFAWPVKVTDVLPSGLAFVGTATPVVTGAPSCGVGSCTAPTVATGNTTSWDFGNIACNTVGGCKITLGISARVAATATRGTTLTNAVSGTNIASQDFPTLTVIEPNLTLNRAALPNSGIGVGAASTVTVTLTNGGLGDAPVVGALVTLPTPANLSAGNYQAGSCPAAIAAMGSSPATFTFADTSATLAVGASCSFTYDLTVGAGAAGNTTIVVPAGSVSTQSVSGAIPPAKLYTATDTGFSITTAAFANGQPCTTGSNCLSAVCDTDNKCGYANGNGPCSMADVSVCRSGTCSVSLVCGPAGGCLVDGDCAASQFCNTETWLCAPKLANSQPVPSIAGHSPALNGVCTVAAATAVCVSGVCDNADDKCGYADGDGSCATGTPSTWAACRSGVCSASGVCGIVGGCLVDGDCASAEYCNTPAKTCVAKLTNGTMIPTVSGHDPTIGGVCTAAAATAVCVSGVCDVDNKCGYADGAGTCSSSTVAVCRSGQCATSGACGACVVDADCSVTQYCNTPDHSCAPKLANSTLIPSIPGHDPVVVGLCNASAATAICESGVCDVDNKCGYLDGSGTCTSANLTVCRSGMCSASGVCGMAAGCIVDADCAHTQYCDTPNRICVAKLPNGVVLPTVTGHSPVLNGTCTELAAAAACVSGVCDVADHRCGYADGDGTCTNSTSARCRSGICSTSGMCGVSGGCLVDGDCTSSQYCDTPNRICAAKLVNGVAIPTVPGHVPSLAGVCNEAAALAACRSGVCDTADQRCGYADGDGTCTVANAVVVCRSGLCSATGVCGKVDGCVSDADCLATEYCNTQAASCAPKVKNGGAIPSVSGHSPVLVGICSDSVAAAVCISASCDVADDLCGLANGDGTCTAESGARVCRSAVCDLDGKCGYADGNGPCSSTDAAVVCRSRLCSAGGTCMSAERCLVDADCSATQFCNTESKTCVARITNGSAVPTISGHVPLLTGACTTAVGAAVCSSGVCDVDQKCGYVDGTGPCTSVNAGVVCRSGTCAASGICRASNGCTVDTDCSASQFCATSSQTCTPKLANGSSIPTVAGHDPVVLGTCSAGVAAIVCSSGVCDEDDNKCGLRDGTGPCDADTAAVVCRTGACASTGVCGPTVGCQSDADCTSKQTCNMQTHQCEAKPGEPTPNKPSSPVDDGVNLEGGGCNCTVVSRRHADWSLTIFAAGVALGLTRRRRRG